MPRVDRLKWRSEREFPQLPAQLREQRVDAAHCGRVRNARELRIPAARAHGGCGARMAFVLRVRQPERASIGLLVW